MAVCNFRVTWQSMSRMLAMRLVAWMFQYMVYMQHMAALKCMRRSTSTSDYQCLSMVTAVFCNIKRAALYDET